MVSPFDSEVGKSIYPAYQTTHCHNPEYFIMKTHRRERPYTRQDKPSPYRLIQDFLIANHYITTATKIV